jgi:predicted nucleic acid-binding protein
MSGPRRLFVDSAVLAYALGGDHRQRVPCRAIVAAASIGEVELHASTEMVQEVVFHRMRRGESGVDGRRAAVAVGRELMAACVLHALDEDVLGRALELISTSSLGGRDAVHAATATVHGFDAIVTPDADFDDVPGLTRIEPANALA